LEVDPFIQQPAPSTVNAYNPNVAQGTVPSNRDVYRIGVGIDLVSVITAMTHQGSNTQAPSSTTQTKGFNHSDSGQYLAAKEIAQESDTSVTEAK
jgi:hypothetical protein